MKWYEMTAAGLWELTIGVHFRHRLHGLLPYVYYRKTTSGLRETL